MFTVFTQALAKEIQVWSRFSDPNVLPLLGYFVEGDYAMPSLVSEWMENGTLTDYIKTLRYCGRETIRIVSNHMMTRKSKGDLFHFQAFGIASGLYYLHSQGVIHGDLKSVRFNLFTCMPSEVQFSKPTYSIMFSYLLVVTHC